MENIKSEKISEAPDLNVICRLCLQPEAGTINIFQSQVSITMRIMACAALEVQSTDGLPNSICKNCRYQLELSYYFRKKCQLSDTKLRKHIRLINAGKKSRVFLKSDEDDDEDEEELQFEESLKFIRENEDKKNKEVEEKLKKQVEEDLRKQIEEELKKNIETNLQEKLDLKLKKELDEKLRELDENNAKWLEEQKVQFRKDETQKLFDEFSNFVNSRKPVQTAAITPTIKSFKKENSQIVQTNNRSIEGAAPPQLKTRPRKSKEDFRNADADNEITSSEQIAEAKPILLYSSEGGVEGIENEDEQTLFLYERNHENVEMEEEELNEYENELNQSDLTVRNEEGNENSNENGEEETEDYIFAADYEALENRDENDTGDSQSCVVESYQIEENGEIQYVKDQDSYSISDDADSTLMLSNQEYSEYQGEVDEDDEIPSTKLKRLGPATNKSKHLTNDNNDYNLKRSRTRKSDTNVELEIKRTRKEDIECPQISTKDLKIFKCSECPQSFTRSHSLQRHQTVHNGREYLCEFCNKCFSCKSSLDRHIRIHTGEKPFTCSECGKSYMQKEVLKRHMAIHTGKRPHQCPYCPRAFVQKLLMTQHINSTHLEIPQIQRHTCHLCPKTFLHASGLSRHLLTHSGLKFSCSECGRAFNDRSSIKRHIIAVHSKEGDSTSIQAKSVLKDDQNSNE